MKYKTLVLRLCNFRIQENCSLDGNYLANSIVYSENIESNICDQPKASTEATEFMFKTHYYRHKHSFVSPDRKCATALLKFIWFLCDTNPHEVKIYHAILPEWML